MSTQIVSITNVESMTSREIADLTGKRHADVMRDIRVMIERLEADADLRWHCETETYIDAQGKQREQYRLDRDTTLTLITGYDPVARMRVIRRWQELEEKQQPKPLYQYTPQELAERQFKAELSIAEMFEVPKHIAQVEVVKLVQNSTGLDYSNFLISAPAQTNIKEDDIMLEPTELAEKLGIKNASTLNKWLADQGLQTRGSTTWEATELGKPHCVIHHWKSKHSSKSGYNLKWSLKFIRSLLPNEWPM